MPGLGVSFGRGAATTFSRDVANSDVITIMGSNMAECHPVAFCWPMMAKLKGAKLIHVDPRFTRTSAVADIHAPIRAGSDVAFLGGLVNYVLQSERCQAGTCRSIALKESAVIISANASAAPSALSTARL